MATGQGDIAAGNVVGSNLLNLMSVLGISAMVAPAGLAVARHVVRFDLPVAIGVALACLPIGFTAARIERWEGAVLLAFSVAYTTWLVLSATGHAALAPFSAAMTGFVVPLTVLTLAVLAWRGWRDRAG